MTEIFSPSMLKTFVKCPKKYFFKYVRGLQMPSDDEIFTEGKNIHALASYYLRGEDIDKMEKSLSSKEAELWNYLKGVNYFKFNTINTEYNLSIKLGNNFFGGRLDALVENNGHYYILDYKTGSAPQNAAYDFQTMIYLLGVNKFYETSNVTFVYLDLKNKSEVKIDLTPDLITEYETKLTEVSNKIEKGEFSASKNDCKHCEYGKICYEKLLN